MRKSLKDFKTSEDRREFIEKRLKVDLENISNFTFSEEQVFGKNIENLIGATQVPLGIAGPLILRTTNHELITTYIPLATTEGALVASINRGCKAILKSGGAYVMVENVGVTRGPVFKTLGIKHSQNTISWTNKNFELLKKQAQATSSHLKLTKLDSSSTGKNLFIRFYYNCQDAMGMNMATIATDKIVKIIEKETKAKCISIAGNFDIDKKPAWLNFILGRGKKVWAEVTIKKKVAKEFLKVTPQEIAEVVYRKNLLGSLMSGSLGFNAHYANIIAAIFLATGQDLAHVVEASLGVTTAEVTDGGDLYFSVYLPSLMVGTVGGGTHLPTQKEALKILDAQGEGNVLKLAKVIAGAVLAGELSLISSQAEGSLAKAHVKLGRKGKR